MNKGLKIAMWTGFCVAMVFVFGYATMLLWNWLMPAIFDGARVINFWQAIGLLVLSKILFSGFGGKGGSHGPMQWKHRYYKKMSAMSPEEKERFKARMWEKWCPETKKTSSGE